MKQYLILLVLALSSCMVSTRAMNPNRVMSPDEKKAWQAELAAYEKVKAASDARKKAKQVREERWYQFPAGTLTIKISGGSGKYRYSLKKGLMAAVTEDKVQDSPVFNNVPAGYYTVSVVDTQTGCEALDYTLTRETITKAVAQFKDMPSRC